MIRRAPKIIEHELIVGHAHIARQQCNRLLLRQRCGSHLIGADRQHTTRQLRVQLIQVRIARQHQYIRANAPTLGGDHIPAAFLAIIQRLALFMDTAAGSLDGGGQAECQFQRVEVPAFGVEQPGLVTVTRHPVRQLRPGMNCKASCPHLWLASCCHCVSRLTRRGITEVQRWPGR